MALFDFLMDVTWEQWVAGHLWDIIDKCERQPVTAVHLWSNHTGCTFMPGVNTESKLGLSEPELRN